ncbi:LIM/homeobox protein Lhx8 [Branchiostoma belcheri]|nr:LIM/homeobox protein Lhx8 [Branchiostoma belcheri]
MSGFGTTVSPLFRTFANSPDWEALYTPCVPATGAGTTHRQQDRSMSEHAEMDSELCTGCGGPIQDKFLLKVGERQWHVKCLRCSVCQTPLGRHTTCYTREADVYCKADYIRLTFRVSYHRSHLGKHYKNVFRDYNPSSRDVQSSALSVFPPRLISLVIAFAPIGGIIPRLRTSPGPVSVLTHDSLTSHRHAEGAVALAARAVSSLLAERCLKQFGTKCAKCCRNIQSNDWVRRAKSNVYHLACFACDACKRQLSTGEEFALHDGKVLCKTHYLEAMDAAAGSGNGSDCDSLYSGESGSGGHRPKRVRTTFTEEQLRVLQANFNIDSNPDGQDLERIAQITGLSKRVTQVWFQNSRARQKKYGNLTGSKSLSPGRKCCIKCGQIYCACVQGGLQATSCA